MGHHHHHHHCCSKQKVKKGLWSPEEDKKLVSYITAHGHACWSSVPKEAGLQRCGKSCRLRWINYLKPDLRRGSFSAEEERIIIDVHRILGNRWAQIAKHLPGRTDNEVKNFWNSCVKKKLIAQGLDPKTHNLQSSSSSAAATSNRARTNSDELSQFQYYARSNNPATAASVAAPFTISSTVKNSKTSFDKTKKNSFADIVPSDLIGSLTHGGMAPPPASNFEYQDALISFTEKNSVAAAATIGFADGSSSSSLGQTNLSEFIEDCMWDTGGIDPLETLKQTEEGGAQGSLCEMEFGDGNGDFELDQMMEFCDGSSMDQLQWNCELQSSSNITEASVHGCED